MVVRTNLSLLGVIANSCSVIKSSIKPVRLIRTISSTAGMIRNGAALRIRTPGHSCDAAFIITAAYWAYGSRLVY